MAAKETRVAWDVLKQFSKDIFLKAGFTDRKSVV